MVAPSYDESRWPLFRIRLPNTALSPREFAAYLDRVDGLFLRGERFAVVIDAREAPVHTAVERQAVAQRMRASFARYPKLLVAMAIVLSSPVQRGIFTAINWLAGPTYRVRAFRTSVEAEAWLRELLQMGPDLRALGT